MDHQEVLREKCGELAKCSNLKEKLDTCNERVSGKSSTTEDCSEELFDFMHCVDHCVSTHGLVLGQKASDRPSNFNFVT